MAGPSGRVRVALVGAAVITTALVTTGVAAELATSSTQEPVVSWAPGQGAPAVVPVGAPTTDTRNCGGYVTGLPVGAGVPEAR